MFQKKTNIYKNPIPSEHVEQCLLVNWWDSTASFKGLNPELLFAIPNGEIRSKKVGVKLKAEGVRAGVPDLFLAIPKMGYGGLFIEMKRLKGGTLGARQKIMLGIFKHAGYAVSVCHGQEEGMRAICDYMGWRYDYPFLGQNEKGDYPRPWTNWGDMDEAI